MTQCEQLVQAIRRHRVHGLTYGELADLRTPDGRRISTCGHKRLDESADRFLKPNEQLVRIKRANGLVAFVVTRATKWTA